MKTNSSVFDDIPSTVFTVPGFGFRSFAFHRKDKVSLIKRTVVPLTRRTESALSSVGSTQTRNHSIRPGRERKKPFGDISTACRGRQKLQISKRNSWVTQDEKNFYSSAHYDINVVSLIPGSSFSPPCLFDFLI